MPVAGLIAAITFSIGVWSAVAVGANAIAALFADHGWGREQLFAATRDALPTGRSVSRR